MYQTSQWLSSIVVGLQGRREHALLAGRYLKILCTFIGGNVKNKTFSETFTFHHLLIFF